MDRHASTTARPSSCAAPRTDARADVYALGCVLYAALTGAPPFPRGTVPATMLAHLHDPTRGRPSAGAPQGFDRVLARALAKDPADRYPSAGDLGRAALAAARGEPVTESERSVAVGPAAPADRRRGQTNGHDRTAVTESLWHGARRRRFRRRPVDPPTEAIRGPRPAEGLPSGCAAKRRRLRRRRRWPRSALALAGAAAVAVGERAPDARAAAARRSAPAR